MSNSSDKIKVLALHGSGQNSLLEGFSPEDDQYFTFADMEDPKSIARVCSEIFDYCDTHGPFDLVGCESIGTAIAATMLLEKSSKPAPFKGAIFFNGAIPPAFVARKDDTHYNLSISIPTANIWGKNDARHAATALALSNICTPSINENFIHENGSTIPGSSSENDLIKAVQAIKKTAYRAVLAH
ncbi:hypothetical protein NHQ30_001484 [Ciborinia camelliae]|nr:hypothetical protein NHQ30_001484 [Ciborinia camelliae]